MACSFVLSFEGPGLRRTGEGAGPWISPSPVSIPTGRSTRMGAGAPVGRGAAGFRGTGGWHGGSCGAYGRDAPPPRTRGCADAGGGRALVCGMGAADGADRGLPAGLVGRRRAQGVRGWKGAEGGSGPVVRGGGRSGGSGGFAGRRGGWNSGTLSRCCTTMPWTGTGSVARAPRRGGCSDARPPSGPPSGPPTRRCRSSWRGCSLPPRAAGAGPVRGLGAGRGRDAAGPGAGPRPGLRGAPVCERGGVSPDDGRQDRFVDGVRLPSGGPVRRRRRRVGGRLHDVRQGPRDGVPAGGRRARDLGRSLGHRQTGRLGPGGTQEVLPRGGGAVGGRPARGAAGRGCTPRPASRGGRTWRRPYA